MGDWSMNESVKIGDKVRLIGFSEDAIWGTRFPGVVGKNWNYIVHGFG